MPVIRATRPVVGGVADLGRLVGLEAGLARRSGSGIGIARRVIAGLRICLIGGVGRLHVVRQRICHAVLELVRFVEFGPDDAVAVFAVPQRVIRIEYRSGFAGLATGDVQRNAARYLVERLAIERSRSGFVVGDAALLGIFRQFVGDGDARIHVLFGDGLLDIVEDLCQLRGAGGRIVVVAGGSVAQILIPGGIRIIARDAVHELIGVAGGRYIRRRTPRHRKCRWSTPWCRHSSASSPGKSHCRQ